MLKLARRLILLMLLGCSSAGVWAQAPSAGEETGGATAESTKDAPFEAGFHLGNLLPDQIDGVTEIMSLGGVRAGYLLAPRSYAEAGIIMGNGEGQKWKNVHADLRMDIPVETLVGIAYVGADMVQYKGVGTGEKIIFGGHAGGGIQTQLTGAVWFRGDMKFSFSPGTTLYIGFGIMWRLGGGSAGGQ